MQKVKWKMGINSWLISLAVASVVLILILGFIGLMCYFDKILTVEQKEKISDIAYIILSIFCIILVLVMLTSCAHLLIFDLK